MKALLFGALLLRTLNAQIIDDPNAAPSPPDEAALAPISAEDPVASAPDGGAAFATPDPVETPLDTAPPTLIGEDHGDEGQRKKKMKKMKKGSKSTMDPHPTPYPDSDSDEDCKYCSEDEPDDDWKSDSDDESPILSKKKKASGGRGFWSRSGVATNDDEDVNVDRLAAAAPSAVLGGFAWPARKSAKKAQAPEPTGKDEDYANTIFPEGYPYDETTPYAFDSPYDQDDDYNDKGDDELPGWLEDLQQGDMGGKNNDNNSDSDPDQGSGKKKKKKGAKKTAKKATKGKKKATKGKKKAKGKCPKKCHSKSTEPSIWTTVEVSEFTGPTTLVTVTSVEVESPAMTEDMTPAPTEDMTPAPTEDMTPAPTEDMAPAPIEDTTPAPTEQSNPAPAPAPSPNFETQGPGGDTIASYCPGTCNPFDPAKNFCDSQSTGCTTTGGAHYYCACRAGYRFDGVEPKDFFKQFKAPGQPYVYGNVQAGCNTLCSDSSCSEVLERSQCS